MSKFGWNEKMALGIESVDREHQKLFEMIDQLQKAMTKGQSSSALGQIFAGLIDYTNNHFGHEARLFEELGYENRAAHLAKHDLFTDKMAVLKSQFDAQSNFMIGVDVMNFLNDWLIEHVMGEDRKYLPLFNK